MSDQLEKFFSPMIAPLLLLALVVLGTPYLDSAPPFTREVIGSLDLWSPFLGMTLAAMFNRGKAAWGFIFLAATGYLSQHDFNELPLLPVLLPAITGFAFSMLMLFPERGAGSARNLLPLLIPAGCAGLVAYLMMNPQPAAERLLTPRLSMPGLDASFAIAQLLPLAFFTFSLIWIRFFGQVINQALTGVQLLLLPVFLMPAEPLLLSNCFTASVLLLATSILRDSYNMAYRDDLTGLPQRRALNEALQGLGSRYCIAMCDVDHFKKFNDTWGHDIGDQVLQMVASQLRKVQGGGRPYRYGGEEFCILFPGKRADAAFVHLDEIRKNIAAYDMVIRQQQREMNDKTKGNAAKQQRTRGSFRKAEAIVNVTISMGVAEAGPAAGSAEEVLKQADQALYAAKEAGRNRVVEFHGS
ncbi:MAG: GGDEF domain-containing protein [Pseudomonadales bacterium]|nr:GGDEF domain-containing protein [Pseudomonadales bacterium]